MNYFSNKDIRIKQAKIHTEYFAKTYPHCKYIADSIENTKVLSIRTESVYSNTVKELEKEKGLHTIYFEYNPKCSNITVIQSLMPGFLFDFYYNNINRKDCNYMDDDLCNETTVLDFASYKNPGGMFIKGSSAQEESICMGSCLYNILSSQPVMDKYYNQHINNTNRALYTDDMLYVPRVVFTRSPEEPLFGAKVLVGAAPNASAIRRYNLASEEEIHTALERRIFYTIYYPYLLNQKNLLLGAFGCGVFGNNPVEVASIYKKYLIDMNYWNYYKQIYFVIPDNNNYQIFAEIFNN